MATITTYGFLAVSPPPSAGLRKAQANGKKLGRPNSRVDRKRILELKAKDFSLRQIAKRLGIGYGTVRSRLLTAHKIQSQRLRPSGSRFPERRLDRVAAFRVRYMK